MHRLPFRISVLIFVTDAQGQLLLIQRRKAPNAGCWSPIGGKLEMELGESPLECALREVKEEADLDVSPDHMHLFGYVSEKAYEGQKHWLMFLYHCRQPITHQPEAIDEGHFDFFPRAAIDSLKIPETDRILVWPWWDTHRERFIGLRADCSTPSCPIVTIEQEF